MAKIQIGKVAFTHEGRYSSSKEYARNTCVVYNGSTYVSVIDVPADHAPDDSGIYWRLMASKGDKGDKGIDGTVAFGTLTADQKRQLKGEKGDDGEQGPKGDKGDKGEPGDMFFLHVNDDGDLVMDTIDDESYGDLFAVNSNGDLVVNL